MKISEAVQFFKGQLDYGFGEEDQKAEEAMQVAIRSLEAWENLDPDTLYYDGECCAFSMEQIEDAVEKIEKGGSDNG